MTLTDLFPLFDRLENGQSVCLCDPSAGLPDLPPSLKGFRLRQGFLLRQGYGGRVGAASRRLPFRPPSSILDHPSSILRLRLPLLGLWSSGSTGKPKLIWHDWNALKDNVSVSKKYRGWTWASPFKPWTFAGVQVALQAWATGGKIVGLDSNWRAAWSALLRRKIEVIACTPTYADLLIQHEPASGARNYAPEQMTLGGEVLRSAIGGRLRRRFPDTRFTVIYATTELGVIMKTNRLDGWYDVKSLESRYPRWRIKDDHGPWTMDHRTMGPLAHRKRGVLEVWRDRKWHNTNDQVEVSEDLIRIIGRSDRVANVAGYKVALAEVEELAERVPGVRHARAISEPSAVTGEIVALQYSFEPGSDQNAVSAALQARLRSQLRKEAWPRRWEVAQPSVGANAKRVQ